MIYICIPTHNEQQTVGVVLWKLRQVLTEFRRDYQLLVADDASSDKTAEVLEPYTRVLPLTVIRSEGRHGCAASLEMLLREAVRRSEYPKRDVIVTLQADFSEEPDDLVPLVKRLEAGADVAVGNKVSTTRDTRARRFARSLARFFMRRQKWPEGVITPFDGYRAYRLYAVKRAIEDRGPHRLIRHEGWAGHAELLRAVLPHARRVDVVDIDDRPDRLQRPRREKPFAAAMQVRVMASGAEPQGLVGVEELDRIALTASRSRERAAITAQSIQAERGGASRTNGSRTRQNGSRRDQGRTRSQGNGAGRAASSSGEGRPRRDRPQQAEGRTRQKGAEAGSNPRSRQAGGPQRESRAQRQPRSDSEGQAPDETKIELTAEGAVAPDEATRPKRKRRRRKRGGQGRTGGTAQSEEQATGDQDRGSSAAEADVSRTGGRSAAPAAGRGEADQGAAEADQGAAEAGAADGPAGEAGGPEDGAGTGAKKRRRRGGRRGGRGRRKPRPEGSGEASAGESAGSSPQQTESAGGNEAAESRERPVAEPVARADND